MKLSLVAIKALSYVHKSKYVDYSKYGSIETIGNINRFEYTYVIDNANDLVIGEYMYTYLKKCNYIESTNIEGCIIRIKLNDKYFYDLKNKQEI